MPLWRIQIAGVEYGECLEKKAPLPGYEATLFTFVRLSFSLKDFSDFLFRLAAEIEREKERERERAALASRASVARERKTGFV